MDVESEKKKLRRLIRARYVRVTAEELGSGETQLYNVLSGCRFLENATQLFAFYPCRNEIDCRSFLKAWLLRGRDLFLPRVAENRLDLEIWRIPDIDAVRSGFAGIPEPDLEKCQEMSADDIDVVLVPGLAFDSTGARLGQGGGYYDRLLRKLPPSVTRIGLGYDWQVLDRPDALQQGLSIPVEPHDICVHSIATPSGLIHCQTGDS